MTLALLCSGQGPQHHGMFALTGDAPENAKLFAHAALRLGGHDAREMVLTDSGEALHQNREGQILCTLQALAARAALSGVLPRKLLVAGYSIGEMAAWGVAGFMDAAATLDVAARRAEVMDAASPPGDGMLFVRGLPHGVVDDLCKRHDAAIAIVNPGGAYVLGANGTALKTLFDEAKAMGATGTILAVNVASHTPRLAAASVAFSKVLEQTSTRHAPIPDVRLFSGIDGSPVVDIPTGLDKLAKQISHTVQWAACLEGCVEAGASAFFELGPGRALSEMAAHAYPDIPSRSLEDFRTLGGARAWLNRAVG